MVTGYGPLLQILKKKKIVYFILNHFFLNYHLKIGAIALYKKEFSLTKEIANFATRRFPSPLARTKNLKR